MLSISWSLFVALALTKTMTVIVAADSKTSYEFETCAAIPVVDENLCMGFGLEICNPIGGHLNVTLGRDILFSKAIADITDQVICPQQSSSQGCQVCFGIDKDKDSFLVKPGYAHICPRAITRCTIPVFGEPKVVETSIKLQCLDAGTDCSAFAASCDTCTSHTNCGWCPGLPGEVGSCMNIGLDGRSPHCGSCSSSSRSSDFFITQESSCSASTTSSTFIQTTGGKVLLGVSVTALGVLLVFSVIYVIRYYKSYSGRTSNSYYRKHHNYDDDRDRDDNNDDDDAEKHLELQDHDHRQRDADNVQARNVTYNDNSSSPIEGATMFASAPAYRPPAFSTTTSVGVAPTTMDEL